jgi:hypothetical protein
VAAKSRAKSASKSGSKSRGQGSGRAQPKKGATSRSTASGRAQSSRVAAGDARAPGNDAKAVGRLVARANEAIPRARVRSAFSGTTPLSPNAVTILGSLPAVVVVGVGVIAHIPWLLAVALGLMALSILVLMRVVNTTCVVAELPNELVVLANRRDGLEPRWRGPQELTVLPYRDRRWARVQVGDDVLWVSRRAFGEIVDRLAANRADADE